MTSDLGSLTDFAVSEFAQEVEVADVSGGYFLDLELNTVAATATAGACFLACVALVRYGLDIIVSG